MPKIENSAVDLFKKKAEMVTTSVVEVKDLQEAMVYAFDICEKKDFCQLLLSGCEQKLSDNATAHCERATIKTIAAPGLDEQQYAAFEKLGEKKDITLIRKDLRKHLAGIDVGFTTCEAAIAETATCVMECYNEDLRLASMVCEVHIIALKKSQIVATSYDIEEYLHDLMSKGSMYTAFVSGSSRTSDIERVLTRGVHGPLELHIALMEA